MNIALCAQLACLWEAAARKPGNVHRYRDFADTTFLDFAASAAAVAPALAEAPHSRVGAVVVECVRLRRLVTPVNTNLGIALLLAPLAKASPHPDYCADVERVLAGLDEEDATQVCSAICLAQAGGLGRVAEGDVREGPDRPLRELMALAADRDMIARQYANGFSEVFDVGAPAVLTGIERTACLEGGIIHAHLELMSRYPDSLIGRKLGAQIAGEAAKRARAVLEAGWPDTVSGRGAIGALDNWLRAEGNSRNPGTTADLIAACLFVLLRTGRVRTPPEVPWTREVTTAWTTGSPRG